MTFRLNIIILACYFQIKSNECDSFKKPDSLTSQLNEMNELKTRFNWQSNKDEQRKLLLN